MARTNLGGVIGILLGLIMTNAIANAHSLNSSGTCWMTSPNGHYSSTSSTANIALTGDYKTAWDTGAGWWTGTYVGHHIQSLNSVNTTNSPSAPWFGATSKSNFDSNGDATTWNILLNTAKLDSESLASKANTAGHELGHVWGLGDVSDTSCATTALMYSAKKPVQGVQQADWNGFNFIWP